MPLFGPPNVEKLEAEGNVKGLIKALRYKKDVSVRRKAADALGKRGGEAAVAPLIAALDDRSTLVRNQVARSLGQLGDARAVEPLIAALENGKLRNAAIISLGELGDGRAVGPLIAIHKGKNSQIMQDVENALIGIGEQAVDPLVAALERGERLAAQMLWRIGSPRAVQPLIAALEDDKLRSDAARALGKIGSLDAVEPLIALLAERGPGSGVAEALGEIGDQRAIQPLIRVLNDSSHMPYRRLASTALAKLGWKPDRSRTGAWFCISVKDWKTCATIGEDAVEPLLGYLRDEVLKPNSRYRADFRSVTDTLGQIGDVRAVEPLIATLRDSEDTVRWSAVIALGRLGDVRAVEPLIQVLEDQDGDVRLRTVEALVELGDVRAVEPLIAALRDEDPRVRRSAAHALGQIGDPRAVEALLPLLDDASRDVRSTAAEALRQIGPAAVGPLIARLESRLDSRRAHTAEALGIAGDARAVQPLLALLNDYEPYVRVSAAEALGQIGDPSALEPLIKALQVEHLGTYRAVIKALAALYKSGALNERQKQLLLWQGDALQRRTTVQDHDDRQQGCFHDDATSPRVKHDDFHALI